MSVGPRSGSDDRHDAAPAGRRRSLEEDEHVIRPSEEARAARAPASARPACRSNARRTSRTPPACSSRLRPQTARDPGDPHPVGRERHADGVRAQGARPRANLIVAGVASGKGIDYTDLHWTLFGAVGLYVGAAVLSYCQAYMVAGVVQRSMSRLRATWRRSSTASRSATSTASRGATCSAASPTTSTISSRACSRR